MKRILVFAMVVLAACTGGEESGSTTTSSSTTSIPTTASSAPSSSADATSTTVLEMSRPGCRGIPANSPAIFDESGGVYAAYLLDFDATTGELAFDVIQWLTGEEAEAAFIEEYGGNEGPPNGYHVKNENDLTRTATVAPDAEFWIVQLATDADADVDRTDPAGLVQARIDGYEFDIWWLTFRDGDVVEVCQQYVP